MNECITGDKDGQQPSAVLVAEGINLALLSLIALTIDAPHLPLKQLQPFIVESIQLRTHNPVLVCDEHSLVAFEILLQFVRRLRQEVDPVLCSGESGGGCL